MDILSIVSVKWVNKKKIESIKKINLSKIRGFVSQAYWKIYAKLLSFIVETSLGNQHF